VKMVRTVYVPIDDKFWFDYYHGQAKQIGHGLTGYEGIPYQRGNGLGSFFGRLFRSILPVAKRAGKSALKAVGHEALNMGTNVIGDLAAGKDVKASMKRHGLKAGKNLLNKTRSAAKRQLGSGIGKRSVGSTVKAVKQPPRKKARKDIFP